MEAVESDNDQAALTQCSLAAAPNDSCPQVSTRRAAPVLVGKMEIGYAYMTPDLKISPLEVAIHTAHGGVSYEGYPVFPAGNWLAIDMKKNIGHMLHPPDIRKALFTNNYIIGMRSSYGAYTMTTAQHKRDIFRMHGLADQGDERARILVAADAAVDSTIGVMYSSFNQRDANLHIFSMEGSAERRVPLLPGEYHHVSHRSSSVMGVGDLFLLSVGGLLLSVDRRCDQSSDAQITAFGNISTGCHSMRMIDDNLFVCFASWRRDKQELECQLRDLRQMHEVVSKTMVPTHQQLYFAQSAETYL